ncbi:MAG TPA: hypothetical protein VHA52_03600, partial [Candidatus Babeliaceae bacterium]|nr:hypothetical protein [Candidatus Babeliaceae bacterium]
MILNSIEDSEIFKWHARIGHQSNKILDKINEQFNLNINKDELKKKLICPTCVDAKATRDPIYKVADPQYKASSVVQVLHGDLVGIITMRSTVSVDGRRLKRKIYCPTIEGHLHALIVTEEFSHCVFVELLKTKDEATLAVI